MGTNYYFMARDKAFVQEYFAKKASYGVTDEEYRLTDEPYLGYEIHICKFSYGWRALFQSHSCYNSLKSLDQFYHEHSALLEIYDEYKEAITWEELKEEAIKRAQREPVPQKWVYDLVDLMPSNKNKTLHTVNCLPEEAELWLPFDHVLYRKTEAEARKRYGIFPWYDMDVKQWNDPDAPVDWMEGEFS